MDSEFWAIPKRVMEREDIPLTAKIVYGIIWTRKNGDNEAWPRQNYIGDILGITVRSVQRNLDILIEAGLLEMVRRGNGESNFYRIVRKSYPHDTGVAPLSEVKPKNEGNRDTTEAGNRDTNVASDRDTNVASLIGRRSLNTREKKKKEKTKAKKKENNLPVSEPEIVAVDDGGETTPEKQIDNEINRVLDVFYKTVNPTINFGNTTNRSAARQLIEKFGIEKVVSMAEYAVKVAGDEYAPVITTPYKLRERLGDLMAHWKRNNSQPNQTRSYGKPPS